MRTQTPYRVDNKKEKPGKAEKTWNAVQKWKRKAAAGAAVKKQN